MLVNKLNPPNPIYTSVHTSFAHCFPGNQPQTYPRTTDEKSVAPAAPQNQSDKRQIRAQMAENHFKDIQRLTTAVRLRCGTQEALWPNNRSDPEVRTSGATRAGWVNPNPGRYQRC